MPVLYFMLGRIVFGSRLSCLTFFELALVPAARPFVLLGLLARESCTVIYFCGFEFVVFGSSLPGALRDTAWWKANLYVEIFHSAWFGRAQSFCFRPLIVSVQTGGNLTDIDCATE